MYSAYQKTPDGLWIGTHRFPLNMAIYACKQFRQHTPSCPVAIVPHGHDPTPIMMLVESLA